MREDHPPSFIVVRHCDAWSPLFFRGSVIVMFDGKFPQGSHDLPTLW